MRPFRRNSHGFLAAAKTITVETLSHVSAALTFCANVHPMSDHLIDLAKITRLESLRLRLQAQLLRARVQVSVEESQMVRTKVASAIVEVRALRRSRSCREQEDDTSS